MLQGTARDQRLTVFVWCAHDGEVINIGDVDPGVVYVEKVWDGPEYLDVITHTDVCDHVSNASEHRDACETILGSAYRSFLTNAWPPRIDNPNFHLYDDSLALDPNMTVQSIPFASHVYMIDARPDDLVALLITWIDQVLSRLDHATFSDDTHYDYLPSALELVHQLAIALNQYELWTFCHKSFFDHPAYSDPDEEITFTYTLDDFTVNDEPATPQVL